MTPLFLVLLSLLAIGHATKSCFELSGANCYYKPEPCPAHLEDCSKKFTCSLSTNKCCCPKSGPPSVPPSGPTRPKLRSCFDSSGANCYYKPEPCPAHLEDCSKKFTCSLSTNKCCCPKSGPPSVPPSGPTPPPTPKPKYCWEHPSNKANCHWKFTPCPWGLRDCSKNYFCPVSTNKCCCP